MVACVYFFPVVYHIFISLLPHFCASLLFPKHSTILVIFQIRQHQGYLNVLAASSMQVYNVAREDMKHFPQYIASNGIFCTGGHMGRLVMKHTLNKRPHPNLAFRHVSSLITSHDLLYKISYWKKCIVGSASYLLFNVAYTHRVYMCVYKDRQVEKHQNCSI